MYFNFGEKELVGENISKPDADIKTLLQNNAGDDANFLLYEASKRNCTRRMAELVHQWGADVNAAVDAKIFMHASSPTHTATPLFAAVENSSVSAVEWLLSAGADPNGKCFIDDICITPLWNAADTGHARIGKLLLDHGADVNAAKSPNGNTEWCCSEWSLSDGVTFVKS